MIDARSAAISSSCIRGACDGGYVASGGVGFPSSATAAYYQYEDDRGLP
jgi:hypothetical protein